MYATGPGNSAHNIQHGTRAESFLPLIVGLVLVFCVLILFKYNNYTYSKRIAFAHMNMQANERLASEQAERKASKDKGRLSENQIIVVKQRKLEDQVEIAENLKESQTPKLSKTPKNDQPKSPWSAPAKMHQRSKSFGDQTPKKEGEKSPKKSSRRSGSKDLTLDIKGREPAMGSPSQSSLAARRGMQKKSTNDGFDKAPTLDDANAPGVQV
jgi:hypothetical protein